MGPEVLESILSSKRRSERSAECRFHPVLPASATEIESVHSDAAQIIVGQGQLASHSINPFLQTNHKTLKASISCGGCVLFVEFGYFNTGEVNVHCKS
jgi:hypothetical protein